MSRKKGVSDLAVDPTALRTDAFASLLLALRYPLLSPCLLQPIIPDSYLTPYPPPTQAALDWASDGTDPFHPYQGGPAGRRTLRDLDLGMSSCGRVGPFLAGRDLGLVHPLVLSCLVY